MTACHARAHRGRKRTSGALEATGRWTAAVRARRPDEPTHCSKTPGPRSSLGRSAGRGWRNDRQRAYFPSSCARGTSTTGSRRPCVIATSARSCSWVPGSILVRSASPGRTGRWCSSSTDPRSWTTRPRCSPKPARRHTPTEGPLRPTWATIGPPRFSLLASTRPRPRRGCSRACSSTSLSISSSGSSADVSRLSAAGSRLAFDIVNGEVMTSPWTRPWVEMQAAAGAPWLATMEDPIGDLADHGWSASLTQAGQPDAAHGRWTLPVIPTTMPGMPHSWFVTAER